MKRRGSIWRGNNLKAVFWIVSLAACVTTAGIFRVWTRNECVRLGYIIADKETKVGKLLVERSRLQAENAAKSSPIRVARMASKQLGLKPANPKQVIVLKSNHPKKSHQQSIALDTSSMGR